MQKKAHINILVKDERKIDTDVIRKVGFTNDQTRRLKYVTV